MLHQKQIVQVIATDDFNVYVYFCDGKIKLYNAKPLIGTGVFKKIANIEVFKKTCTVINGTLAWDPTGNFDEYECLDIDPIKLYEESKDVADPLQTISKIS